MKLLKKTSKPAHPSRCPHNERLTTINFGLERSVCVECGDVTVRDRGHTGSGDLFTHDPNKVDALVG